MLSKSKILDSINAFDKSYDSINKNLNCFTSNLSDFAKSSLDKFHLNGKLSGKLIAIKDNINIKDYPTSCVSEILKNNHSLYNATVIDRLIDAEGLIVAKTNMDEFAMGSSSEYSTFGPVLNPHNKNKVSGGSSGGSAAAVSGSQIDIALGSDTGGSVRQPASFCGVYGLKPTYGRISRYGLTAFASSLDQIGIFTNKISDIISTFESIAGFDKNDSNTSNKPINNDSINLEKIKIAYSQSLINQLDIDVRKKINDFIELTKSKNIQLIDIDLKIPDYAIPTYYIIAAAEASSNLSRFDGIRYGKRYNSDDLNEIYEQTRSNYFGDEVKRRIMIGNYVLSSGYYDAYYKKAQKVRRIIRDEITNYFNEFDMILFPTSPTTAFGLGEKKNKTLDMYLSDIFTIPISLAGLPALNIPISKINDLPIGVQLCANYFNENNLFAISKLLED